MNPVLSAFLERGDIAEWTGLPAVTRGELDLDEAVEGRWGSLGDPPRPARWCAGPQGCFEGGTRCWLDPSGTVDVLEGVMPASADGEPLTAPGLGEPSLRLDAQLDEVGLRGGELVYPDRGLAVRMNPENGLLLGLVGFVPTTAEDYVRRLRPAADTARPRLVGRVP